MNIVEKLTEATTCAQCGRLVRQASSLPLAVLRSRFRATRERTWYLSSACVFVVPECRMDFEPGGGGCAFAALYWDASYPTSPPVRGAAPLSTAPSFCNRGYSTQCCARCTT